MLHVVALQLLLLLAVGNARAAVASSQSNPTCSPEITSLFCREDKCLPRVFILGAAKSSTTSLWSVMRWQFGNVCSPVALEGDPKWYRKEGTFFNVDDQFDGAMLVKQEGLERYRSRYVYHACPNRCSSFIDATPGYLHHPQVARRMHGIYTPEQRKLVKFIIMLREPMSRDLSWFSVGEGIKSADWWRARKESCGGSMDAAATCYHDSVKVETAKWKSCMNEALNIYSLNCEVNPTSCLQLMASSEAVMAEVYEQCSKDNRVALGIYVGQLVTWIRTWEPWVYNNQFLVIKNTDLVDYPEATVVAAQRHVAAAVIPSNTTWRGTVPVENETKKKKEYLSVIPYCDTERLLRKFYEPYNDMLHSFCLDHQLGSCVNAFVFPQRSNCLKKNPTIKH